MYFDISIKIALIISVNADGLDYYILHLPGS